MAASIAGVLWRAARLIREANLSIRGMFRAATEIFDLGERQGCILNLPILLTPVSLNLLVYRYASLFNWRVRCNYRGVQRPIYHRLRLKAAFSAPIEEHANHRHVVVDPRDAAARDASGARDLRRGPLRPEEAVRPNKGRGVVGRARPRGRRRQHEAVRAVTT